MYITIVLILNKINLKLMAHLVYKEIWEIICKFSQIERRAARTLSDLSLINYSNMNFTRKVYVIWLSLCIYFTSLVCWCKIRPWVDAPRVISHPGSRVSCLCGRGACLCRSCSVICWLPFEEAHYLQIVRYCLIRGRHGAQPISCTTYSTSECGSR